MSGTSNQHPTTIPLPATSGDRSTRWRLIGYWLATGLVAAELGVGGIWDIQRLPMVRDLVTHLGYPSYFLVLLGSWKVLGALALPIPRARCSKEWPMRAPSSPTPGRSSPT